MNKNINTSNNTYNVVDLFSGAGGLSRGFMDAGFNVVLGVDFDDAALKTFKENHGNAEAMKLDLFDHDNIDRIVEYLKENKINLDVLVGGPPCQGFSLAGKREEFDQRNILYSAMVKTAAKLKPKVVVLENVPGMLTLYNGAGAKRVKEDFEEIGYNVIEPKILYAPEYGVPQIRKRVFFVMTLKDSDLGTYEYQKRQEQQIYLTTDNFINNENILSVAIQLLNYYGEYGLYNIGKTLIEVNGDGEINWFKTINEMPATLSGNSPVYIDYYSEKNITDTQNMIRQIQLAVLTDIKEKYNDLLSLLDYDISFEDEIFLSDLGDEESFLYHLDKELMIQFISHKIELIKLLKMYIQSKTRENNVDTISVFGVTKFDRVWEDVCKVVYEDNLEHSLIDLNLKYRNTYENNIKLKEFVPKPTWTNLIDGKEYSTLKSLELDTLHVNKENKTFEIYDAKYYLISFANNKINGQPGVSDITKQYLYELTYKELAEENGYSFINRFIVPIDNKQQDNQLIAKASFSIFDMYNLSDIVVLARDCETIYEQYLSKV